jgi:Na+/proline symporter
MGIIIYILGIVFTYLVAVFLMTRYGKKDYNDVVFHSTLAAALWPVTVTVGIIVLPCVLIARFATRPLSQRQKDMLDRIRYGKKKY